MTPLEDWPRWKYVAVVAGSFAFATAWAWSYSTPRSPEPTQPTLGTLVVPATAGEPVEVEAP